MKSYTYLVAAALLTGLSVASTSTVPAEDGASTSSTTANLVKTLDYGSFQGFYDPITNTDNWLGMPFAVGGRLQNPTVISSANRLQGLQDATRYGPACPQTEIVASPFSGDNAQLGAILGTIEELLLQNITDQSEDCLSINVQIPHGLNSTAGLPIMMWIFGGGFELGSSASVGFELTAVEGISYQGANLVARSVQMGQPIVFISANYRLNAFGTLASQEITDAGLANLMLKDQRVAMQWVQKYISQFGGDPSKVTLFGQSAGSLSIATHMVLNDGNTEGLFRAAIMLSGGAAKWSDYTRGQAVFDAVMRSIGCDQAADKIACFRSVPYDSIYTAVQEQPSFFSYESTSVPWYPRPDGIFLTASPNELVAEGKVANIPYIIGDMKDEGTLFSLFNQINVTTNQDFIEYFSTVYFPEAEQSSVEQLCSLYSEEPTAGSPFDTGLLNQLGPQYKRLAALIGDYTFETTRRDLLAQTSSKQNAWSYQIETSIPLLGQVPIIGPSAITDLPILGSFHTSDVLLYVFGTVPAAVSRNTLNLMTTFIAFANNLDPNTHEMDDVPYWPQYNTQNKTLLRFRETGPDLIPDTYRQEAMDYINANPDQFKS